MPTRAAVTQASSQSDALLPLSQAAVDCGHVSDRGYVRALIPKYNCVLLGPLLHFCYGRSGEDQNGCDCR